MANTFELIASSTVGSGGAASIDFTSIPSTYTDLAVYISARGSAAAARGYVLASINGVTTNRSWRWLVGYDSSLVASASSTNDTFGSLPCDTATASTFGNIFAYFPNYAGSNNKSFSVDSAAENNSSSAWMDFLLAGLWSSSSAISSLSFYPDSGTFKQYSTAYLYGVKNA
jgi:hypothetical protein